MSIFTDSPLSIKETCSYYLKLIDQSAYMEKGLSSFASSLKTSLMLIPNGLPPSSTCEDKDLQNINLQVKKVLEGIRTRMHNDVSVLSEISSHVERLRSEFRRLIDLVRIEISRPR